MRYTTHALHESVQVQNEQQERALNHSSAIKLPEAAPGASPVAKLSAKRQSEIYHWENLDADMADVKRSTALLIQEVDEALMDCRSAQATKTVKGKNEDDDDEEAYQMERRRIQLKKTEQMRHGFNQGSQRVRDDLKRRFTIQEQNMIDNSDDFTGKDLPYYNYHGYSLPDYFRVRQKVKSAHYYLSSEAEMPKASEETPCRHNYLVKNASEPMLIKNRLNYRQAEIDAKVRAYAKREEMAYHHRLRLDDFRAAFKGEKAMLRAHRRVTTAMTAKPMEPFAPVMTPRLLATTTWLRAVVLAGAIQNMHRTFKTKKNLRARLQTPKCIQVMWRAKRMLRLLRRRVKLMKQLVTTCYVGMFAARLLYRLKRKRAAFSLIARFWQRRHFSSTVLHRMRVFHSAVRLVQRDIKRILSIRKAKLATMIKMVQATELEAPDDELSRHLPTEFVESELDCFMKELRGRQRRLSQVEISTFLTSSRQKYKKKMLGEIAESEKLAAEANGAGHEDAVEETHAAALPVHAAAGSPAAGESPAPDSAVRAAAES